MPRRIGCPCSPTIEIPVSHFEAVHEARWGNLTLLCCAVGNREPIGETGYPPSMLRRPDLLPSLLVRRNPSGMRSSRCGVSATCKLGAKSRASRPPNKTSSGSSGPGPAGIRATWGRTRRPPTSHRQLGHGAPLFPTVPPARRRRHPATAPRPR
jgi:hypothetical protein